MYFLGTGELASARLPFKAERMSEFRSCLIAELETAEAFFDINQAPGHLYFPSAYIYHEIIQITHLWYMLIPRLSVT